MSMRTTDRIALVCPELAPLDELVERLREVLASGRLTNAGEVERFEQEAAELLEAPEVVAVSSCTSGLMLVERCLALRGEVITPSFTFFAGAHGLLWNGLKPVLADCDPETFQIDPASVKRLLSERTGAILGVHLFGCPAPVDDLEEIATKAGVPLIFDGAHALGTRWRGRDVSCRGDAVVYSLSPTKQITSAEGGLIATRHRELADMLRRARNYGKTAAYDCDVLGLNARMTELQAAIGRAALPRLDEAVRRRNQIAAQYRSHLGGTPRIGLQQIPAEAYSSHKDFAILLDGGLDRDRLQAELEEAGIETRAYFDPPLHRQALYRRFHQPERESLQATEYVSRHVLCLPIHTGLSDAQVRRVAGEILRFVDANPELDGLRTPPPPAWSPLPIRPRTQRISQNPQPR